MERENKEKNKRKKWKTRDSRGDDRKGGWDGVRKGW